MNLCYMKLYVAFERSYVEVIVDDRNDGKVFLYHIHKFTYIIVWVLYKNNFIKEQ